MPPLARLAPPESPYGGSRERLLGRTGEYGEQAPTPAVVTPMRRSNPGSTDERYAIQMLCQGRAATRSKDLKAT